MAPALVQTILEKAEENEQKALQSVSVQKAVDLTYDLRHLAAFDENPIDLDEFRFDYMPYQYINYNFCFIGKIKTIILLH